MSSKERDYIRALEEHAKAINGVVDYGRLEPEVLDREIERRQADLARVRRDLRAKLGQVRDETQKQITSLDDRMMKEQDRRNRLSPEENARRCKQQMAEIKQEMAQNLALLKGSGSEKKGGRT